MTLRTIGMVLAVGALAGCAGEKTPAPAQQAPPPPQAAAPAPLPGGTIDSEQLTATATVASINQKTRHVTLRRPDGTKFTIIAGPEVHNLKQVKKGDVVRMTYQESVAYQVQPAGSGGPGVSTSRDRKSVV